MTKVLVSGYTGFIGSNLTNYLQKNNYSISGLSRNKTRILEIIQEVFLWDELEIVKEKDFKVFIHLAGKAHDLKNTSNNKAYHEVNTALTIRCFDFFLQRSQEILFISAV